MFNGHKYFSLQMLAIFYNSHSKLLFVKQTIYQRELEQKINQMLSGNGNVDICILLEILNKKMKR